MARVERFEDLIAWKKARALTKAIYQATSEDPFSSDRNLVWQIQSASVSIMSNIAEGFERHSQREFQQFLNIAKGSAGEVRSKLYVALDVGYLDCEQFECLLERVTEVTRIISGLRSSLGPTKPRG